MSLKLNWEADESGIQSGKAYINSICSDSYSVYVTFRYNYVFSAVNKQTVIVPLAFITARVCY